MSVASQIEFYRSEVGAERLVAVSKTKPVSVIEEAYEAGQRIFGENRALELEEKHAKLPKDIEWHMIGHLQTNKVKYIAPFVSLIHAVDSPRLLKEIQKQAAKNDRVIPCLLQLHIAQESAKYGFDEEELIHFLKNEFSAEAFPNVEIHGLMGMATFTDNEDQVRAEFKSLADTFSKIKSENLLSDTFSELSMGMSGDYKIAIEEGSTMVRIGSAIFGSRS